MANTPARLKALSRPRADEKQRENPSNEAVLHGSLAVVPIFDVIQWVCSHRQSWVVRLLDQGIDASVTVSDGELADARWGAQFGQAALVEVMETRRGRFELEPLQQEFERTLHGNWQLTLLTAAQTLDERMRTSRDKRHETRMAYAAGTPASLESGEYTFVDPHEPADYQASKQTLGLIGERRDSPGARRLDAPRLIDLGFAAIKAGDINGAKVLWTQALQCDPDNRALQFNLRKLGSSNTR